MKLELVLETVLYHATGEEDALFRFYGDVLGLQRIGGGLTFRVGPGMLLLFNRERSSVQSTPPPHGAAGPGHTCFVADDYEGWRQRIVDEGVAILEERTWDNGVRSFYFHDPAGNIVELIAHRGVDESERDGPFTAAELVGVSELGLVGDRRELAAALGELGLAHWTGDLDAEGRLAFVGEKARTLILSPPGRGWLPTGRPSEPHPVDVTITGTGRDGEVRLEDSGSVIRVRA